MFSYFFNTRAATDKLIGSTGKIPGGPICFVGAVRAGVHWWHWAEIYHACSPWADCTHGAQLGG